MVGGQTYIGGTRRILAQVATKRSVAQCAQTCLCTVHIESPSNIEFVNSSRVSNNLMFNVLASKTITKLKILNSLKLRFVAEC
jgi:hypothetical protein